MLPLDVLGLVDTRPMARVYLFKHYTEKKAAPFAVFHAELKPRTGGGPTPAIVSAELHVELRLGWIRSLLYLVRRIEAARARPPASIPKP